MEIFTKKFDELTIKELYEILKLRNEVFIVEQECCYQDIDGVDYESTHVFIVENDQIEAYLRYYPNDSKQANILRIGRVVTRSRGLGYGDEVMKACLKHINNNSKVDQVILAAQYYAVGFYKKLGFVVSSDVFLEDGIEHVMMKKQK